MTQTETQATFRLTCTMLAAQYEETHRRKSFSIYGVGPYFSYGRSTAQTLLSTLYATLQAGLAVSCNRHKAKVIPVVCTLETYHEIDGGGLPGATDHRTVFS